MSEYINIKGQNVRIVSSDPSNPSLGQLWYNTTVKKLKTNAFFKGWSTGGTMGQGMYSHGCAGTQTSALSFGGTQPLSSSPDASPALQKATQEYNGSAWTAGGILANGRNLLGGAGASETSALAIGGGFPIINSTEEYNGSAWTAGGNLGAGRYRIKANGIETAALATGGRIGPPTFAIQDTSEEYDGSSWTAGGTMNTTRQSHGEIGTQTAALVFAGGPPNVATSEEYDGTSWTAGGTMGTARYGCGAAGTQTAGLAFGGSPQMATTEEYNGTAWSATTDLLRSKRSIGGAGIAAAALAIGGSPSPHTESEEFSESTGTREFSVFPGGSD